MKKHVYLFAAALLCFCEMTTASVGDTTWVQSFNGQFTHYGTYDTAVTFPSGSVTYRKIYMIATIGEYNCPSGTQLCHQYDYDIENYVMTPAGDTLEIARFITPFATAGTPGFTSTWKQHYIFDVTDYYNILKNSANMRVQFSGYSYGFTGDVKFAFIEGTPERNVLGYTKLWDQSCTYGDPNDLIDSHITPVSVTPPAGTQSAELKFAITGHGSDNTTQCCEFDNTGVGHVYTVLANSSTIAQYNMNINCGVSEIYPQGGTWLYGRAGNWCPGLRADISQYKLRGLAAGVPGTVDVDFDDTYSATPGQYGYGSYKIAGTAFYYAGFNKTLDASLEDVIAPTNFEFYRRENPRASAPVVKVRNTGSTTITSLLFNYGVQDSAMTQYIWLGSIAPLQDTIITLPALPALTNLSLGGNSGLFGFVANIQQVNGQQDNDQSNDAITSQFLVAPTWPSSFLVAMKTSSIGANGNLGQSPADASWQIVDMNNNVVASRLNGNVSTTYNDTVTLNTGGYYTLTVSSSQCYGLNWQFLVGQSGYIPGSFAVKDYNNNNYNLTLNGNNVTSSGYHDDFGCGFTQYFTVLGECGSTTPTISRNGDTLYASAGISYQWYKNGVAIPGATNSSYGMTHNDGNYTVQVTDGNTCVAQSASIAVINLGIAALKDQSSVQLVPNPASDMFLLNVNPELIGTQYTLTDMTGRELTSGNIQTSSTRVSAANLSAGVYLVTITDGTSSITKRIAIAK